MWHVSKIEKSFRNNMVLTSFIVLPNAAGESCRSKWPCGLRRGSWPLSSWDRGFESRLGMDVCPRLSMLS
jgi:hypothetical protein